MVKKAIEIHGFKKVSPGLFLVLISNLGWMGAVTIPFMSFLSAQTRAVLIPVFVVSGQVLFYAGLALLGKNLAKKLGKKTFIPVWISRKIKLATHRRKLTKK